MDSMFFVSVLLFFWIFKKLKEPLFSTWNFFPLAEQVTSNLKELAQQVTPGDVVSMYGVRKAMGISIPSPIVESSFVDLTEGTSQFPGRAFEYKGHPAFPSR